MADENKRLEESKEVTKQVQDEKTIMFKKRTIKSIKRQLILLI